MAYDKLVPEVFVHSGVLAMEFYKNAFGAVEVSRTMTNDGTKLLHGQLTVNGHSLVVCDEFEASQGGTCKAPRTLGGTCMRIILMVDDADATVARAVAAGARVMLPVADMFWGGRYGKLIDPFGHEWGINQQKKEQSEAETNQAAREYFESRKK